MVLVYTHKITPRLRYTFTQLFTKVIGLKVSFTTVIEEFISHDSVKMSYTKQSLGNEFFVRSNDLLFEQGIEDIDIKIHKWEEVPCFFITGEKSSIPYDIFAASFYLLSRYEEYLPHVKDEFGRYTASESLAAKHDFLRLPVIDIWCQKFKEKLQGKFPDVQFAKRAFAFSPVINIPVAYAYKRRGIIRTLGGTLRDVFQLQFSKVAERFMVLLGFKNDPFDSYQHFIDWHKQYQIEAKYFFLIGSYAKYDKTVSIHNNAFKILLKQVSDHGVVSLLASYESMQDITILKEEKRRLSDIIHRPIRRARQHYNRLNVPTLYRNMVDLEIKEDYSMGYYDTVGFRAGTCTPFYFYDISIELQIPLKVHPFAITNASMKNEGFSDDDVVALGNQVKELQGEFIPIFENTTFAEKEKAWKETYVSLLNAFSNKV